MFDFLKELFNKEKKIVTYFASGESNFTGALIDNRTEAEKEGDIHFEDIVGKANVVDWKYKEKKNWRRFPVYNQFKSFMCGANAMSKSMGILNYTRYGVFYAFSRAQIYQRRANKWLGDGAGMTLPDMFKIAGLGVTLEQLTNENILTDYDADKLVVDSLQVKVGEAFSVFGGVYLPNDMEIIASTIQTTNKGIILLTYFTPEEWSRETPVIIDRTLKYGDSHALRHFVVACDNFYYPLNTTTKVLKIEDSAHFGGVNERLLTLDWIKNRVTQVGYPMNFKFLVGGGDRPAYDGITIISAQKCLRFEGLFPTNVEYFEANGPTTKKALQAFQIKYGLSTTSQLDQATKNKLHQLYP